MKMYFNEDFESHNKEVNEIIDDLGKKRTKSEEGMIEKVVKKEQKLCRRKIKNLMN